MSFHPSIAFCGHQPSPCGATFSLFRSFIVTDWLRKHLLGIICDEKSFYDLFHIKCSTFRDNTFNFLSEILTSSFKVEKVTLFGTPCIHLQFKTKIYIKENIDYSIQIKKCIQSNGKLLVFDVIRLRTCKCKTEYIRLFLH